MIGLDLMLVLSTELLCSLNLSLRRGRRTDVQIKSLTIFFFFLYHIKQIYIFHAVVRQFSNRSQMASKGGKNIILTSSVIYQ